MGFSLKKLGRFVDPSKRIKQAGRAVDKAVGGAKGWSGILGAAGTALQFVPGVGTALGAAALAGAAGTASAARKQGQAKQLRTAEAAVEVQRKAAVEAAKPINVAKRNAPVLLAVGGGALLLVLLLRRR